MPDKSLLILVFKFKFKTANTLNLFLGAKKYAVKNYPTPFGGQSK